MLAVDHGSIWAVSVGSDGFQRSTHWAAGFGMLPPGAWHGPSGTSTPRSWSLKVASGRARSGSRRGTDCRDGRRRGRAIGKVGRRRRSVCPRERLVVRLDLDVFDAQAAEQVELIPERRLQPSVPALIVRVRVVGRRFARRPSIVSKISSPSSSLRRRRAIPARLGRSTVGILAGNSSRRRALRAPTSRRCRDAQAQRIERSGTRTPRRSGRSTPSRCTSLLLSSRTPSLVV